ncbi:hypothetical protein KM043_007586 [Ampulex compressa]|nr:hypothetical protein KM043_007586 [Ampulex compressa]
MTMLRAVLFKCHGSCVTTSRDFLLKYALKGREHILNVSKREFTKDLSQSVVQNSVNPKCVPSVAKFAFGGLGIISAYALKSRSFVVECKAYSKVDKIQAGGPELSFKWKKFFTYLYPHFWHLLVALSSALVVALLNIWIPQCVGSVINVLTDVCRTKGDESVGSILSQLTEPAFALARMYIAQAFFTFVYIYTLSHVGERVATNLRQDLFKSIIMQDVAFFDKNRTGEIVSRLTSDIQDFKSTFK